MVDSVTVGLVKACEAAWGAIRSQHPDVPDVVLTIGSGTLGFAPGQVRLGHFAPGRWEHAERGELPELFLSGEGLERGPVQTLGTLLHEATHGVASVRGIKDTSRQGRWHNTRFRDLASELGLEMQASAKLGWSVTTVPDATAKLYRAQVTRLDKAIVAFRRSEIHEVKERKSSNNPLPAECGCPRRIRVAKTVADEGPILCGICSTPFVIQED